MTDGPWPGETPEAVERMTEQAYRWDVPHPFVRKPGTGMNFCAVRGCARTIAEHDEWEEESAARGAPSSGRSPGANPQTARAAVLTPEREREIRDKMAMHTMSDSGYARAVIDLLAALDELREAGDALAMTAEATVNLEYYNLDPLRVALARWRELRGGGDVPPVDPDLIHYYHSPW